MSAESGVEMDAAAEMDRVLSELSKVADSGQSAAKFMPTTLSEDPIVASLCDVCGATRVSNLTLLDRRWNGNKVFRYDTDVGSFFVKLNLVKDLSVFMLEAVSLNALLKTATVCVPRPLHLGKLPRVGEFGPGSFMVLDHFPLSPLDGTMREAQKRLGGQLAALHLSDAHDKVHKGRYGFVVNNFLSLTAVNNSWCPSWEDLFTRRLDDQLSALRTTKPYAKESIGMTDDEARPLLDAVQAVIDRTPQLLAGVCERPSLLHGDLWVGNAGVVGNEEPVVYDPACLFGHSEFDLALVKMYGGFDDNFFDAYHALIPKAPGFDTRLNLYQLYHYLNQLNIYGDAAVYQQCHELADLVLAEEASR